MFVCFLRIVSIIVMCDEFILCMMWCGLGVLLGMVSVCILIGRVWCFLSEIVMYVLGFVVF